MSSEVPRKGDVVKIVKKGRGKNCKEVGTIGVVKSSFVNSWGTGKLIVLDRLSRECWATWNQVEIISREDKSPDLWKEIFKVAAEKESVPMIGIIKHIARSGKSSLVKFTNSHEKWMAYSMCPDLRGKKKGETVSILVPLWLAKKDKLLGG